MRDCWAVLVAPVPDIYTYIYIYIYYIYININIGGSRVQWKPAHMYRDQKRKRKEGGARKGAREQDHAPKELSQPQSKKSSQLSHTRARRSRSQRHLKGSKPCVAKRHRLGGLDCPNLQNQEAERRAQSSGDGRRALCRLSLILTRTVWRPHPPESPHLDFT